MPPAPRSVEGGTPGTPRTGDRISVQPPRGGTASPVPPAPTPESTKDAARAEARARDQFYTRPDVAATCWGLVEEWLRDEAADVAEILFIEPSAGAGAFFKLLPEGSVGIDIDPRCDGVMEIDFLEFEIEGHCRVIAVGNPPFGRQASMAKRFFARLARHPQVEAIAFIFPRSFKKPSIQRDLDLHFHLQVEWEVPRDAFLFQGKPFDKPAIFMIWVRRPVSRMVPDAMTTHPDFAFVTRAAAKAALKRDDGSPPPFVVQRVGNAAGKVHHDLDMSESSHLFILPTATNVEATIRRLQPEFRRVSRDVAGTPSIAKSEIVSIYRKATD